MKLLKLVPDNTNIDFMRWRNIALILSILVTVASLVLVGVRGLNLGIDFVGGQVVRDHLRAAGRHRGPARPGRLRSSSAKRASRNSATPRPTRSACRKPEGRDAAASAAVTKVAQAILPQYPGAGSCRRIGVGQGQRRTGVGRRARDRLRDAGDRDLHLVPVRMAIRRRRAAHPVPRRVDDARLLRADAVAGRSQHRRGVPRDRRLFAQRHGRHLRPNPRESAQISARWQIVPLLNLSLNETLSRTIVTSLSIMLALAVLLCSAPT